MNIKCDKCGHVWDTKSDYMYVSCPSCMSKVKRADGEENGTETD